MHRTHDLRSTILLLLLFVLLPIALAQPSYGGTLRIGLGYEPISLDPHLQTVRQITELVYDSLVETDPVGNVIPGLAHAWEVSEDGLTWTFHLREGVTFHDGDILKASDVVYTIERIKDPDTRSPRASDFAPVERIEAPDDLTVVFTLSEPFSPLLSTLGFSVHAILSKDVASVSNVEEVLVGTGPFRYVSHIPQSNLILERYDDFWQVDAEGNRLPYLDRVEIQIMPDTVTRTTALLAGAIDFIDLVPPPDAELIRRTPEIELVGGPSSNIRVLGLNVYEAPLDDRRVRQAIAHAIDEEQIIESALFGEGFPALGTTIPPDMPFGIDTNPYFGKNTEEARRLLAEAGYPDGFDLTVHTTAALDIVRAPAEVIQANLAEVGIRVSIEVEDFSLWLARTLDGDFEAVITGVPNLTDPDSNLFAYYHSDGSLNINDFSDQELDTLLDVARKESDLEVRHELYVEVQERILDLVPAAYLFHSTSYEAIHPKVRGFEHSVFQSYLGLRGVWLEE